MRVAMTNARMLLFFVREAPTERLPGGLAFGDRVLRSESRPVGRMFIRRFGLSPGSPRTATPSAIGCKPTPRNQNGEWLTHSLLVHWVDTH